MRLLLAVLLGLTPAMVLATDTHDFFDKPNTLAVALTGGDTFSVYTLSVSSSIATTVRAAVTNRSRRKLCIENQSNLYQIGLSSAASVGGDMWILGESTNTATVPIYCTVSSAKITAIETGNIPGSGAAVTSTVRVIEETQSIP